MPILLDQFTKFRQKRTLMHQNTATAIGGSNYAGQLAHQAQPQKSTEPTQIQACVQVMEEEAKRLRAVVEHLAGRLHDVLTPAEPASGAQGQKATVETCPLTDILAAQIYHVGTSREILENLLRRIQL